MKILIVHNYYQQRGGEDQCFEDEVRVLRDHGHDVLQHVVHNDSIANANPWMVAVGTLWNRKEYRFIQEAILQFKPDVMHAMNTFPLLSPSVLYAAKRLGIPVVHEIQNYRLACAGAYLLRDGKVCEKCVGASFPLSAIRHRCYRGSLSGSAVVASTIALHRFMRTWQRAVDVFLCPSEIAKRKLIEFGLPEDRIQIKKNSLDIDPGPGTGSEGFAVFVGRLSPEKGLSTLLKAWVENRKLPLLKIVGDGPMRAVVQEAQGNDERIEWLGRMPIPELLNIVGRAQCLVMPSVWYETFGRTTVEAFAKGTPVVGSRIGGTAEIIDDGRTGWLFTPGDSLDLAQKIETVFTMEPAESLRFRVAARQEFLSHYTSQVNYESLLQIYHDTIERAKTP